MKAFEIHKCKYFPKISTSYLYTYNVSHRLIILPNNATTNIVKKQNINHLEIKTVSNSLKTMKHTIFDDI